MALVPIVVENDGHGERSYDLYSRLMKDRIIFINDEITDTLAGIVVASLLFLNSQSKTEPIHMYIQSPGGVVTAGLSITDTMNMIDAPVYTYCLGMCASMGAVIFSQGEKGHRYILPHSEVMIHQPLGGARGQCTDILIAARSIEKTKRILTQMLADATGQPYDKVEADCDRDHYLDAEEAVAYGIADVVMNKPTKCC